MCFRDVQKQKSFNSHFKSPFVCVNTIIGNLLPLMCSLCKHTYSHQNTFEQNNNIFWRHEYILCYVHMNSLVFIFMYKLTSMSTVLFLGLLVLASQRAEVQFIELFGSESMKEDLKLRQLRQRGNAPSYIEFLILNFVVGKFF